MEMSSIDAARDRQLEGERFLADEPEDFRRPVERPATGRVLSGRRSAWVAVAAVAVACCAAALSVAARLAAGRAVRDASACRRASRARDARETAYADDDGRSPHTSGACT